jgi:hypothetical protein
MRPNIILQPPVIPFAQAPAHVRAHLGLPKCASVTRDGRLTCSCSDCFNCTCKLVTRDAKRVTRDQNAAVTIVMAIRHLESRVAALEAARTELRTRSPRKQSPLG